MLRSHVLLLVGFSVLQASLIGLFFCARCRKIVFDAKLLNAAVFVGMEAICIVLIVLGDFAGVEKQLAATTSAVFVKSSGSSPEAFVASGDPLLVRLVESQNPSRPRPDYTSPSAFRAWQESLHHELLAEVFNFGDIGSPVDVRVQRISSTVVDSNITRIFLVYESFDGTRIPAYLFLPPRAERMPAILVLHGHLWNDEGEGITQTAGIVDSYQHGNALQLARAGYVTLTIEFRGFGYLGAGLKDGYQHAAYNALLGGSFYKAIVSRDVKYAVDLLQSLEEVDPQRIGITGASLGGEMAVVYAALDKRMKAVVFQAYGGNLGVQRGSDGKGSNYTNATPFQDHVIPGQNRYLYEEDFFLLIAPRPLLGVRGDRDYVFRTTFPEVVGAAYRCLGMASAFEFSIVPGGHEYFVQPTTEFFKRYL